MTGLTSSVQLLGTDQVVVTTSPHWTEEVKGSQHAIRPSRASLRSAYTASTGLQTPAGDALEYHNM